MELKQKIQIKQTQKMMLSAKMQQSIQILQLPILELNQLIAQEMVANPVLEDVSSPQLSEPTEVTLAKDKSDLEADWLDHDDIWLSNFFDKSNVSRSTEKYEYQQTLIKKSATLQEDLLQQFRLINDTPGHLPIAEQIIGDISNNGYLTVSIDEIAQTLNCEKSQVEHVLSQIQSLEPAGVGARSLKECLLIQLKRQGKGNSTEAAIVENFLNELAAKKFTVICKALKIPLDQLKKCVQNIGKLDPKPCGDFAKEATRIIPDIILEKTNEGYEITINTKNIPELSISKIYKKLLNSKSTSAETLKFIREKFKNAQDLITGLSQRHETLKRVTDCIIGSQPEFIEKGISQLNPLTLKEIATKLELHPSTISRAIANKFIQTPYGTFALKKFFAVAIATQDGRLSNQKIISTIDALIKTEAPAHPLSDQQIVKLLAQKNIHISRRTVTKYRNKLKVASAHLRKS